MPKYTLDQTIFFLRPINKEAIAILNATENDPYRFEVAPPDELTDQPSGEISDEDFASSGESGEQLLGKMSEVAPQTHNPSNSVSTESSRDACQIHRLLSGLDSTQLKTHLEMDLRLGVRQDVTSN